MKEPAKMPGGIVRLWAKNLPLGKKFPFEHGAIVIDQDLHAWVNPHALPAMNSDGAKLLLERTEDGFRLDLTKFNLNHSLPSAEKPEAVNGTDWIPVVEIVMPTKPQ